MEIERLEKRKEITEHLYQDGYVPLTYCDDIIALIDAEIARQSVTSEEVAEAINDVRDSLIHSETNGIYCEKPINQRTAKLAITALQQYQPWVSVEDEKPESGKHVLLCCEVRPSGKRYVCDGYYAAPKSIACNYSDECDTEYDEETDEYYLLEGYYEVIKNWDDYSSIVIDDFVTHWKPLPAKPKDGEE